MTGLYDPRGLQSPPTDQGTAMRCDLLKPAKKMTKDQERAAFLDWHNNRRSSNQNAWAAWQARASLAGTMQAAIRAVVSPEAVWQPIATAPRDGTSILVSFGEDAVSQARYSAGLPRPWQFIDIESTKTGKPWLLNFVVDGYGGPSHWMHLPQAKGKQP